MCNYGTNVSFQGGNKCLKVIKNKLNKKQVSEQLSKLSDEIKFAKKRIETTRNELRKTNYNSIPEMMIPHYYIEGMEKRLAELKSQYNKLQ